MSIFYCYLTAFIFSIYLVIADDKCVKNSEKPVSLRIKEHVFCDYDKTIRPVIDNSATSVEIKLLVHNLDFMEYSNHISIAAWFAMRWTDEHIHWDPEQFENIEHIFVTSDNIWIPDFSIYNRGTFGQSKLMQKEAQCLIFYTKKAICVAQTSINGMCLPDLRHWPFDVQNCTLKIGSWYHTGEEINILDAEVLTNTEYFFDNPEWKLESVTSFKDPGISKGFPNSTFPSVKFNFVIRRNANVKVAIIIVPYIVLISMSILTLWLDPTSPDRLYIMMINIPLHIMFMLNFCWEIPESGETIPYLILLLRNSQIIVTITLIETLVVRNLLSKTKESPRSLVNLFSSFVNNKIGQLLLFSELSPENAAENLTCDDSANLVETRERPKEWYLLGRVIDRLCFVFAIFTYFIMFVLCIPKY